MNRSERASKGQIGIFARVSEQNQKLVRMADSNLQPPASQADASASWAVR